jgi:hypothetical protein
MKEKMADSRCVNWEPTIIFFPFSSIPKHTFPIKSIVKNYTLPMKTRAENHTFPKKAVFYPYKT